MAGYILYKHFRNLIIFLTVLKVGIETTWSCQVVPKHARVTKVYLCGYLHLRGLIQENKIKCQIGTNSVRRSYSKTIPKGKFSHVRAMRAY